MMEKKVMQGAFIPMEVKNFLTQQGKKEYPPVRPSTLAGRILIEWSIANGMSVKKPILKRRNNEQEKPLG